MMELYGLFPVPLGIFKIQRDITKEEINFLLSQEKRSNENNTSSSNFNIIESKPLKDIKLFCQQSIIQYISTVYNPKYPIKCRFTQSWANYTEKNQSHHYHTHQNSFISGVFYLQSDKSTAPICFHVPNPGAYEISTNEHTDFSCGARWFEAEAGSLLLFPSSLPHSVQKNNSDTTRISISFNTFLAGRLGEKMALTELYI